MIRSFIKEQQPVVYQVLENGLKNNSIAHAYLFSGVMGSLQHEVATLLIQSLLCEQADPWACETCTVCKRVSEQNYSDMVVLDGSQTSIKKEDVLQLQNQFSLTAREVYGKKIYVIVKAENMTRVAMNALLKFLEEPSNDVIGILIAENESSLLPTIVSRCQVLNFKKLPYRTVYEQLVKDHDSLASYFYARLEGKVSGIEDNESFQLAYKCLNAFLEVFYRDEDYGLLLIHQIIFAHKDKNIGHQAFYYFLDMLIIFYNDIINMSTITDERYQEMIDNYRYHSNYTKHLEIVLDTKRRINRSVNLPLVADQMVYMIKEENNGE